MITNDTAYSRNSNLITDNTTYSRNIKKGKINNNTIPKACNNDGGEVNDLRFHSTITTTKQYTSNNSIASRDQIDSEDVKLTHYNNLLKHDTSSDQCAGSVDKYGFEISKDEKRKSKSVNIDRRAGKKEIERSQKWISWFSKSKRVSKLGRYGETSYQFIWNQKFVDRVYKGIPDPWRNKVWNFMLTAGQNKSEYDESLLMDTYKSLLNLSSIHEKYIDLNVSETLRSHIMFKSRYGPGQRSLFNVLRAFSNYNEEVGFSQGMANVVAILLMYYPEEDAFVMLIKLFSKCDLHNLYVPGFPSLMEGFYIQEQLMKLYVPKLTDHFEKLNIISASYSTKWYSTLFSTNVVAHNILLRFWDLIMMNGFDILYYIAISLLIYNQSKLLKSDFCDSLEILLSKMEIKNEESLFKTIKKLYNERENKIEIYKDEYRKLRQQLNTD